jgi:hypothetical protein
MRLNFTYDIYIYKQWFTNKKSHIEITLTFLFVYAAGPDILGIWKQ